MLIKIKAEPQECIFVDDSEKNINAARSLGIHGILYKYGKLPKLIKEFQSLDITV
jgi:FMN phosphatase YigB (HAD superfamily)